MTWKGQNPVVTLVTKIYKTGVKLTKQAMAEVESQIQRLTCLLWDQYCLIRVCVVHLGRAIPR
jgi:hypothetical protein